MSMSQQEAWLWKEVHSAGLICPDAEHAVLEQRQAAPRLKHMGWKKGPTGDIAAAIS